MLFVIGSADQTGAIIIARNLTSGERAQALLLARVARVAGGTQALNGLVLLVEQAPGPVGAHVVDTGCIERALALGAKVARRTHTNRLVIAELKYPAQMG